MTVVELTATDYRAKALRGLDLLPPFSPILSQLMATMAEEDVSFSKLATLIERDTVLSANVLRLVNSALYGRRGTISSIRHAVSVIGLTKLRNYLFGLSISKMWAKVKVPPTWSMARFNEHSVATAVLADLIAQQGGVDYPEGAFAAGLLHDLGRLIIATSLPNEYALMVSDFENGLPWEESELRRLGVTHGELSADALARWNLPEPIQRAVREHEETPTGPRRILGTVIHLASNVANRLGHFVHLKDGAGLPDVEALLPNSEVLLDKFERDFNLIRSSLA